MSGRHLMHPHLDLIDRPVGSVTLPESVWTRLLELHHWNGSKLQYALEYLSEDIPHFREGAPLSLRKVFDNVNFPYINKFMEPLVPYVELAKDNNLEYLVIS